MPDFRSRRWDPPGPRLHVLIPATGDAIQAAAAAYEPVLRAQPGLRLVPPDRLHLTLAWVRTPMSTADMLQQRGLLQLCIQHILGEGWPDLAPQLEPPIVRPLAVRMQVTDLPQRLQLLVLAARVHEMMAEILDAAADIAPPAETLSRMEPHVALAYAVGPVDTDRLTHELDQVAGTVPAPDLDCRRALIVNQDTFTAPADPDPQVWPISWQHGRAVAATGAVDWPPAADQQPTH